MIIGDVRALTDDRVAFYSDGKKIKGNLHLPERKSPPCVVTLHGLDSSKDSRKWSMLASNLCGAGFACLRLILGGVAKEKREAQEPLKTRR